MYLYGILHNNKNATVAGCSALEIGANHPGSNRPVLSLDANSMVNGFLPNEPILEWSAGVLTGFLRLLRLLRLLRENHSAFTPSPSPRWVGRVGNQNCTGSGGGAVPEALKMRFSPIWTGLSH